MLTQLLRHGSLLYQGGFYHPEKGILVPVLVKNVSGGQSRN